MIVKMKWHYLILFILFPCLYDCQRWKALKNKPKVFYRVSPFSLQTNSLPFGYDRLMPPIDSNQTLQVNISVSILHIAMFKVTEKALPVQMFVELSWSDLRLSRLYFNQKRSIQLKGLTLEPKEEFALKLLMTPSTSIWMPSVQMNSFTQIPLIQDLSQVVLVNQSYVHYLTRVTNRFYCDYVAWHYPHERFNCSLSFSIPNDSSQRIFLQWDQFRREPLHMNGFQIDHNSIRPGQQCRPFAQNANPTFGQPSSNHDWIIFESCADIRLRLARELGYFMLALYLPSGCCVQMALCNFLLPVGALNARMLCIFLPLGCLTLLYNSIPVGTGYNLMHSWLLLCQVFVLLCFPYLALAAMERAEQLFLRQNRSKPLRHKTKDALSRRSSGQVVIPLPASLNVIAQDQVAEANVANNTVGKPDLIGKRTDAGVIGIPNESVPIADNHDVCMRDKIIHFAFKIGHQIKSFFCRHSSSSPSPSSSPSAPVGDLSPSIRTSLPVFSQPSLQALRLQKEQEMVSFSTLRLDRQARMVMPALFYCCTMIYVLFVYSLDN